MVKEFANQHVISQLSLWSLLVTQCKAAKKYLVIPLIIIIAYFGYYQVYKVNQNSQQTQDIINSPKINDIYFFDFRVLSNNLRPNEKYRLAKVVDITGDIVTLVYGSFYYQRQHAAINSIYYGQLSYKDYFEAKRYDYNHQQIQQKLNSGAIYLAMRPLHDKLLGQRVGPELPSYRSSLFIQGKKENIKGEAFLKELYSETNLQQAFELFTKSASYNFAPGQINLAEMYINGQYVERDFEKALYWLNLASLQSSKKAILKYEIICKQVPSCQIYDFFQNLITSGVDVKVRHLDSKINNI